MVLKGKELRRWIIKKLSKVLNRGIVVILFIIFSCEDGGGLNESEIRIIKTVLLTDSLVQKKNGDYFYIEVFNSELKTEYAREMGASLSSLIIYDRLYNNQKSLSYNSYFGVKFNENVVEYKISLLKLSQAKKGREVINEFISSMIDGEKTDEYYYDTESNFSNMDWSTIKNIGEIGFKEALVGYNGEELNSILFHYEFEPSNKTLWFYYNPDNNKIITIIDPYEASNEYEFNE